MVITDHPGKFSVIVVIIVLNGKEECLACTSRVYRDNRGCRSQPASFSRRALATGGGIKTRSETTNNIGSPSSAKIITRISRHEGLTFDTVGHRGSSTSGVREETAARRRKPG